jgi:hypothetical protein
MLIETCLLFDIDTLTISPFLSIPIMMIIIYILSTLISFILMQIPIVNKYIL